MKLSIITINRNNAAGLRKTIESVVSQTYTDFEYIIIDGASTDDSVDVIKEYAEATLPCGEGLGERLYWVSEPDNGIYNAMNKGILKAKGEYLLFMNSGDWLVDEEVVRDFCNSDIAEDVVFGNIYLVDNEIVNLQKSVSKVDFGFEHFYFGGYLPHQSSFIKKELFLNYGLYNESYKISADFDFFVNVLLTKKASYNYFNRIVSYYDLSGISSKNKSNIIYPDEREYIMQNHVPLIYKSYKKKYEENLNLLALLKEYENLKKGRFSFIVKFLLLIKEKKKKYYAQNIFKIP